MQIPRVGMPDVGHKSLTPSGESLNLQDPFLLWLTTPGLGFLVRLCLSSYLSPCVLFCFVFNFILYCGEAVQLVFTSFSEEIVPDLAVDLFCLWKEVNSESSYTAFCDSPFIVQVNTNPIIAMFIKYDFIL